MARAPTLREDEKAIEALTDVALISRMKSALRCARRGSQIARLVSVSSASVIATLGITLSMYHISMYLSDTGQIRDGLTLSLGQSILAIALTGLCLILPGLWVWFTFDSQDHDQHLEAHLIERGFATPSHRGLLTTLSQELDLSAGMSRHRQISHTSPPSIDRALLVLIAHRAEPMVHALPKVTPRPPWELSGLTLLCALWVVPTMTIHIAETSERDGDERVIALDRQKTEEIPIERVEREEKNLTKPSQRPTSERDLSSSSRDLEPSPSSTRRARSARRLVQTRRHLQTPDGLRRLMNPRGSNQRPPQKISRARAQRGGQVSSGDATASSPHRVLRLSAPTRSARRDDAEVSQPAQSISHETPLSRVESAYFYGIPAQRSLSDFPPELRLYGRGGTNVD